MPWVQIRDRLARAGSGNGVVPYDTLPIEPGPHRRRATEIEKEHRPCKIPEHLTERPRNSIVALDGLCYAVPLASAEHVPDRMQTLSEMLAMVRPRQSQIRLRRSEDGQRRRRHVNPCSIEEDLSIRSFSRAIHRTLSACRRSRISSEFRPARLSRTMLRSQASMVRAPSALRYAQA
jgi:hypothetical protein